MFEEKRIALVIGNSAYSNASLLKNPLNDARDIAAALARLGFSGLTVEPSTSSITNNEPLVPLFDLTYERLRKALAAFARAAEETDQAVLYYAGHGIEVGGRNYLIPIDARLEHVKDVRWETAALDDLMIGIEEGSGLRLIILDACRDNPFRSRMISTRSLSRGLASVEPPGNDILVAYSSEHGKVALDGTSGNSPYAAALLNYLERPGLEISELFREVRDHVKETTRSRQKPHTYGQLGRRKYYFVPPSHQKVEALDDSVKIKRIPSVALSEPAADIEHNSAQNLEQTIEDVESPAVIATDAGKIDDSTIQSADVPPPREFASEQSPTQTLSTATNLAKPQQGDRLIIVVGVMGILLTGIITGIARLSLYH